MHHYVNAIQDTKGNALIGYFVRCVDSTTGLAATLYADTSLTPIASVSGVANAAQVNTDGNASFYIAAGTYHLDIYATDSTTFVRRIQNIPMVDDVNDRPVATPISYGAKGDGTTDDYAAFAAAIAALPERGGSLYVPRGYYRLSQKLVINKQVRIFGEGWSQNPGTVGSTTYTGVNIYTGSIIVCDAGVGGIQFVAFTDNASNATAYEYQSSTGSILQDIMFYSLGGTGTAAHGVESFVVLNAENVRIEGFAGCGMRIAGDGSGTANQYGNTALTSLKSVSCRYNKLHGFSVSGNNSSVIHFIGCDAASNGGVGFLDASPFGNLYLCCHTSANNASYGTPAGYSAGQRTQNTTDWAGLSDSTAGSYVSTNAQGFTPYIGCYSELDTGYKAEMTGAALVIGGLLATDTPHTTSQAAARWNKSNFRNIGKIYSDSTGVVEIAKGFLDITNDSGSGYVAPATGGRAQWTAALGLMLGGTGSSYDFGIRNAAGTSVMLVAHNSTQALFPGSVSSSGNITSSGGGVGYEAGAGGSVTQATSKSTGVTLNRVCGQITMNSASLAATTAVSFTLTNSTISAQDTVQVCIGNGATAGAYAVDVDNVGPGSCRISIYNRTAGALAEAIVLNFTVLKGVVS